MIDRFCKSVIDNNFEMKVYSLIGKLYLAIIAGNLNFSFKIVKKEGSLRIMVNQINSIVIEFLTERMVFYVELNLTANSFDKIIRRKYVWQYLRPTNKVRGR